MYLPHAGQQLDETTITISGGDNDVGRRDVTGFHVDGTQDECGEGESTQAQRSRIAELARVDRLVQTGLELTTEGTEVGLGSVDMRQRAVTKAGGGARGLLRRHGVVQIGTITIAVGVLGRRPEILLQMLVLLGRHDDELT